MDSSFNFVNTYNFKLIYIFKIDDELHKGILKIGESTLNTNKPISELVDNCEELNNSARNRIRQYTNTIGIQEDLLYTTLAIDNKKRTFKDKDIHRVLKNSGIIKHDFGNEKDPAEWYETNLETAKNAINAVKEGRKCLNRTEIDEEHEDIEFRPEQKDAIDFTLKRFNVTDNVLWNAKMRFGKTLSALEVIKRMSDDSHYNLSKVIILTHRPVVDEGWFQDYKKIFWNRDDFQYGSKNKSSIHDLISSGKKFIYFASMQDLRGSGSVGGKFNKNDAVFNTDWDLLIVDEAHEGTQTELGQNVIKAILESKIKTPKSLMLSGTPFNLLSDFESNDIYTWDYIMEQKAKLEWEVNHPLEPNPYEDLPRMNILTYNLEDYLPQYQEVADSAFNFREFFRVWTGETERDGKELIDESRIGKFIHEDDVNKFLELLTKQDDNSNYPFSRQEYIDNFKHSFWILPGIKEAKALKELMLQNRIFSQFNIVNVAGTGDDNGYEALDAVERAIGDNPDDTYTITLSCGKLTTGVTVKPWTAVLYLAGSYSTSASSYLQTIFRVQSPSSYGGKQKDNCYVFDFAPDRTLKMVAEAGDLCIKVGSTGSRESMKQFLNYCPVIAVNGSEMKPYNVNTMLQQLKKAYVERVVDNGFDDAKIYNDNLLKLDDVELKLFDDLKGIIGASKQKKKINDIDINKQGFTEEEWTEIEKAQKKPKRELTEEQKRLLEEIKEKKKQRNDAISILRGISIRIPLLIYGADIKDDEDVTIDNFTKIVDDVSWEEFMPKGITKEKFSEVSKYYDNEIFIGAGRRIRNIAKHADTLSPIERAKTISDIFSTFRNPDKETVLTPWRTVNMHMGDTLGGWNFYDNKYIVTIEEPRFINNGDVTRDVLLNKDAKILEFNSKTGLYPLYVTISLFKHKCLNVDSKKLTEELMEQIWEQTIEDNIFIVCKTPMAKTITKRTLIGYKNKKTNILNVEDVFEQLSNGFEKFSKYLKNPKTWEINGGVEMKFDAIIGNPPYQENISSSEDNSSLGKQLFPTFISSAIKLNPKYVSLITPSRWFAGDAQDKSFLKLREFIKENNHISKIVNYPDCKDVFDNVAIKGGVSYFLFEDNYNGNVDFYNSVNGDISKQSRPLFEDGLDIILSNSIDYEIIKKVQEKSFVSITEITKGRNAFGIVGKPDVVNNISQVEKKEGLVKLQCKGEEIRWTDPKNVTKNIDVFESYKVFISKSSGDPGKDRRVIGRPYIGEPYSCCTDSLIPIGKFNNIDEVINLQSYLKTRFVRFMISILKVSQNVSQNVYQFVPMQNFKNNSDINWGTGLDDLDEQLYKKYNFTDEQINWIMNKVDKVEY